ncbi:hypothetical protein A9264_15980 [Vibrio sp. UCD-FRSSP16_10]|uniref:hypothetical protein n=1 Tax=unclassified Vibrio TaxID=2614977 RepID=UPI0007FEB3E9|nr:MULTISPECIES: hypothetical protein [unclassified Vibrio]OBT12040.1 hypothetical protein A9260_15960 [Vibrio sp. UCD-FRSSP16_30]OBT18193.1 hypothetical protein A9264_15980 [Vibrio sp. UCD-FRSSP16_10]
MNDRVFQVWQQKREQGFLSWLYKSTLGAMVFYMVFNIVFQFSAVSALGILAFLQSQVLNYALFAALILCTNGLLWLYRESSYKKEARRRNIM